MAYAYPDVYLSDAKDNLAICFDYLINHCNFTHDQTMNLFIHSGIAGLFGSGNPHYLSGMSGVELGREIFRISYKDELLTPYPYSFSKSPEYWAGFYLAEYQWRYNKSFELINNYVSLSEITQMYTIYHEMDITHFEIEIERRINSKTTIQNSQTMSTLKRLRTYASMSQSMLADKANVGIRSIQMYEQGIYDMKKAEAGTILKLAKALGVSMEELLE